MKRSLVLLFTFTLTFLFIGCHPREEKPDLSSAIVGKWKLVKYNGHVVETNNRTVFTFNSDFTGTQTEASVDSVSLLKDKTWRRAVPLTYALDGAELTTLWQNTTDARRWIVPELTFEDNRMSSGNSTLFKGSAPSVLAPAEYESVTDIAHYAEDIIGTWTGKAGSGGQYGDIDHHWVYFSDGTYEYRSPDGKGNYVTDPEDIMNEYILDGDFFITRWTNPTGEHREAHDVSIYGNEMIWRGLRANGKRDSFFLERITPTRADIEPILPGKWIVALQDGDSVLTNNKSVHTFDGKGKVAYTVANAGASLQEPWENQTELTYILMGNDLTEEGRSTTGAVIKYNSQFLKVSQDQMDVQSNIGQREGIITLVRDKTVDYHIKIRGFWEGVRMEGPGSYGGAEGQAWEYFDDGTYAYYTKDPSTGKWGKQETGEHFYIVDGSFLACRWASADVPGQMDYEWWDLSFSPGANPDSMYWDALRVDSLGNRYHNKFFIKRGSVAH